jgi:hypothetical protein
MFDLRYHVASLAAVFLALIVGILVGVGISDPVDNARKGLLEREVANLHKRLDQSAKQAGTQDREQAAAQTFISQTYPLLVHNRLKNRNIAVIFVGSFGGGVRTDVTRALSDAGLTAGQQFRLRALKVPIDGPQIDKILAKHPDVGPFTGPGRFEALGRALGQELMLGGDTPLWNALTDSLVEQQAGGTKDPADGVIVVRTAAPQRDGTSRYLQGLYSGLASTGVPAVGVEGTNAAVSAVPIFRQAGLSTVDDVDTAAGKLALVFLLRGAPGGQYGLKKTAHDGVLPPLQTTGTGG